MKFSERTLSIAGAIVFASASAQSWMILGKISNEPDQGLRVVVTFWAIAVLVGGVVLVVVNLHRVFRTDRRSTNSEFKIATAQDAEAGVKHDA